MFISQPQHVRPLERKMEQLLEKAKNKAEILRAATYYPGKLPWAEEQRELKRFHARWHILSSADRHAALLHFVKKYGWFNEIEGTVPFDEEHYRNKIAHFEEEKVDRPKNISIPKEIFELGQLIGELGFLRFWNRWHFMHIRYHIKKILTELVLRSEIPDLEYATVEEVMDFFERKKINLAEIRKRKQGYISLMKNGAAVLLTGEKAKPYLKLVQENARAITELRGTIANKGKIIGRVRIISFAAKDYDKQVAAFQKDEILVTGMTRPQIVHLCSKAAAIVTDEGGITSHAAVVSRELNVPCIIATHNATKIFKTGDLVEVDAVKGIVRKLRGVQYRIQLTFSSTI